MKNLPLLLLLFFGTIFTLPTHLPAQPPPGITENPEGAVRLRTLWVKTGGAPDGFMVGMSAVGLGDVNKDGFDDVSVRVSRQHWIFLGGSPMATEPAQILDSTGWGTVNDPVVGDFLGTGENLYGYLKVRQNPINGIVFVRMVFFRYDPDSMLVPTDHILSLRVQMASEHFMASDLDGDGDDELIFVNREGRDAVVRIYEGGESFSLDVPTKEIRATISDSDHDDRTLFSSVSTFDRDLYPDLAIGARSRIDGETRLLFWWGNEASVSTWSNISSRVIDRSIEEIGIEAPSLGFPQDLDGDQHPDPMSRIRVGEQPGTYIWLSRENESLRTRVVDQTTHDLLFHDATWTPSFGFVADSLERYEMMTLLGGKDAYGLGGGQYGPNDTYDAHFGGGDGPAFGGVDAGDVNGDGWRDRLIASSTYGGPGVGRAVIVAGGPYIPVDDPTVSVQSAPVAGEPSALHLWPNPVVDNLHFAWRGDLSRMPHLMRIYNALGQLIEERGLPTWKGTTTWNVTAHPAGAYTIVLFDTENRQLGTLPFVLQP